MPCARRARPAPRPRPARSSPTSRLVGLGQHHHRLGAAAAHQQQVALDAARVEVGVQPADDEHGVDVGRDQLLLVVLAGGAALDRAAARQQGDDLALRASPSISTQSPTAGRAARAGSAGAAIPAAIRRVKPRLRAVGDHVAAAVLLDHPRRPRLRMRGQQPRARPGRAAGSSSAAASRWPAGRRVRGSSGAASRMHGRILHSGRCSRLRRGAARPDSARAARRRRPDDAGRAAIRARDRPPCAPGRNTAIFRLGWRTAPIPPAPQCPCPRSRPANACPKSATRSAANSPAGRANSRPRAAS